MTGIEIALIAGTVASVGAGLAASDTQARGIKMQGEAEARAAEAQSTILKQRAASERAVGKAESLDFRKAQSRVRASSIARGAASGITTAGSPLLVDEAFVKEMALGASRIRQGAEVRAVRAGQQAGLSANQAGFSRTGAKLSARGARLSGFSNAFSTLSQAPGVNF